MKTWLNNQITSITAWATGKMIECDSSAIKWVRYRRSRHTLTVCFNSGNVYEYGGVTPRLYRGFVRAGSKGRFFSREIRDMHPYRRLETR